MSFAHAVLRTARRRNRMSLDDTARAVGRHRSVIARYETGESWPSARTLGVLVEVLDIDPLELFPAAGPSRSPRS